MSPEHESFATPDPTTEAEVAAVDLLRTFWRVDREIAGAAPLDTLPLRGEIWTLINGTSVIILTGDAWLKDGCIPAGHIAVATPGVGDLREGSA